MKRLSLALVLLSLPLLAQAPPAKPAEPHLVNVQKLTAGGENAEAYWSPDGKQLVFQSRALHDGCDQIYTMDADGTNRKLVSTGKGRTTCAYFLKDGSRILFASTHAASPDCPPPPDSSKGYVWPVYGTYRICSARPDGTDLKCLTPWEGYNAEATVSPDGKTVVFTSDKDGDLDLYAMDPDGQNVRRLTTTPGYDGGAFFSPDSKQIVFRGFHPEGPALEEYRALLKRHLVRPSVMELFVADADGTNVRQVTKNGAANFCPFFTADGKRILFSSNLGDPKGREFDLYLVNVDGTGLEPVTSSPGFDGFPMLSPDGKRLAFCSNRDGGQPGETNVFVADWLDTPPPPLPDAAAKAEQIPLAPDPARLKETVYYLASDALQGRLTGTPEGQKAADYVAEGLKGAGLLPVPGMKGYMQEFEFVAQVLLGKGNALAFAKGEEKASYEVGKEFMPATFAEDASLKDAPLVFAGYGIVAPDQKRDDYAGLDVKGKVVVAYKWGPDGDDPKSPYALYYPPRYKAMTARDKGAAALLLVSPDASDDELPDLKSRASAGGGSLPVATVKRAVLERWLKAAGKELPDPKGAVLSFEVPGVTVSLTTALVRERAKANNVVAWLPATVPTSETVVVGSHYDHLGLGIEGSLAEKMGAVHHGADDNASGTAAVVELARLFAAQKARGRNLLFASFGGEELGTLGSSNFVKSPPVDLKTVVAMFNFDMVGRLRQNKLVVNGSGTSPLFKSLIDGANTEGLKLTLHDDGYGASDQSVFYGKEIPVLFFFTGAHEQYHRPEDTADLINYDGEAEVLRFAGRILNGVLALPERPGYIRVAVSPSQQAGRSFRVYMGTIPDFTAEDVKGVRIQGVRAGSPAELGGLKSGDVLVSFGGKKIENLYDYTFALQEHKPGETVAIVVLRDGKEVPLTATLTRKPGE